MTIQAFGKNYFFDTDYPITVTRIDASMNKYYKLNMTEKKHFHDFSELVIVSEGTGIHWVEGTQYNVVAGDVFFIQGKQEHYFKDHVNLVVFLVMYQPDNLPLPLKEMKSIPGFHAIFVLEPAYRRRHKFESHLLLDRTGLAKVESIVKNMRQEIRMKKTGFKAVLLGDLIQLIIYLSRRYSEDIKTSKSQSILRVAEMIGWLEQNYAKSWKISDLAKLLCVSDGHLHRIFKEATGQSPIDYLLKLRLQRAMELLSGTHLSITEIAFSTGFNDSNYFTRQFKKVVGVTPCTYRRQLNHH